MSTPRKMSVVSKSREWLNTVGEDARANPREKRGSRHCEAFDREVKPVEPQAAADVVTLMETVKNSISTTVCGDVSGVLLIHWSC